MKPHVEKAVLTFGMVNPVLALPQIYKVWGNGAVGGLSSITVGAALTMSLLMALWGVLEKSAALWAPALVWTVINATLLLGIVRFG